MELSLDYDGPVAVLTWRDGENRINDESLGALHARLDELEARSGPLGVVLTGEGKFFSNGLDLARYGTDPAGLGHILTELHRMVVRLLTFPAYTVGALNGHTFAGGALLSCALDYRVMREDRGFWCMNEADIGLALDAKLAAILFNRLPRATAIDAMLTARRFDAPTALHAGIVEAIAPEGAVLERAVAVAAVIADKDRGVIAHHKRLAYGEVAATLGFPVA